MSTVERELMADGMGYYGEAGKWNSSHFSAGLEGDMLIHRRLGSLAIRHHLRRK